MAAINGLTDRGHFDTVQVAPGISADVPDEPGGVRAVVLGVAHPHSGRDGSEAQAEAKDIMLHRGSTPRVYRNMLIFIAAEQRQLDNVKDAQRASLAWAEIVRETQRLNLTQSDSALAAAKAKEASDTLKTRMKEAWCYLLYPVQETAQSDVEWMSAKVPAQDGILARAGKKLVSDQGIWPELGPDNLNRQLEKYIWSDKPHLHLRDLWEYLNRYVYLPRIQNRAVLTRSVLAAVSGMLPGPFAYAERWEEAKDAYAGLVISGAAGAQIVIDDASVIVRPEIAERHQARNIKPPLDAETERPGGGDGTGTAIGSAPATGNLTGAGPTTPIIEVNPTRFVGTVMISADRPARDIHQVVEAIVEQLTTLPGSEVSLKLEIDAEVPSGLDRAKVRTLLENASTLGFIDKAVR